MNIGAEIVTNTILAPNHKYSIIGPRPIGCVGGLRALSM